jgi:hypothetical protein
MAQAISLLLVNAHGIFDPGAVRVRFVVNQVSLRQVFLLPHRSVSFHQCSILIFNLVLFLEGQVGKPWKPSR